MNQVQVHVFKFQLLEREPNSSLWVMEVFHPELRNYKQVLTTHVSFTNRASDSLTYNFLVPVPCRSVDQSILASHDRVENQLAIRQSVRA